MARIEKSEPAVVVIGSGAGGGTLAYELTAKGVPVVVIEAGPYLKNDDYENDEWKAFGQMAWLDPRTTSGSWRVSRDFPNLPAWTVKAVGGSTTHWSGATPRFRAHEFKTRTTYGRVEGANLLDWPITLQDLEPYYDRAEQAVGSTHRHGRPPLPANNNYKVFANGAERIGYKFYATGPYGTNAEPYDGRPASIQDGFNFQGDKHKSKWSTLVREIPRAEETGHLDLRAECQAVQITHDAQGKADAVLYLDKEGNLHRQAARVVCVAGNTIESARLLLLSASALFPDGLANSSGQVGRNYMRHTTGSVYAFFDQPVRMYRGETMAGIIADESRHDTDRGFAGGYYMETISLGPAFLASFVEPGAWGRDFTRIMDSYPNTAGMWIVGEDMPQESNRITLNAAVTDANGLPVPNVHFDDHPNDVAMRDHGYTPGRPVVRGRGRHRNPSHASVPVHAQHGHVPDERRPRGRCRRRVRPFARRAQPVRQRRVGVHDRCGGEPDAHHRRFGDPAGRAPRERDVEGEPLAHRSRRGGGKVSQDAVPARTESSR